MIADEATWLAYILGQLSPSAAADLETELARTPEARAALAEIREALTLGMAPPPVAPAPGGRERLLRAAAERGRFERWLAPFAALVDRAKEDARALLAAIDRPEGWGPGPWPQVQLFHFQGGPAIPAGADVGFVRVAPGAGIPRHGHGVREHTLVLQGAAREDTTGQIFRAGELVVRTAPHGLEVVGDVDLLFAVVLEGGLTPGD